MKAIRAALASVVLSSAALGQIKDAWIGPAREWIGEVPEQLLAACLQRNGGSGVVEVRINAQGMVALEALLGGAPVQTCAALVGAHVGASSVTGGFSTRLYFDASLDAGRRQLAPSPREALEDMGRPRLSGLPFRPCQGPQDCSAGQTCDVMALGSGTCLGTVELWRSRARREIAPSSPPSVHLLPRADVHCAGVGNSSERVIVRVVDTSLRPIDSRLTVLPFRWAADGGVVIREVPAQLTTDIGKGRGLSPDRPTLLAAQPEGCSSSSAVIAADIRACVLLVVECPEGLIGP